MGWSHSCQTIPQRGGRNPEAGLCTLHSTTLQPSLPYPNHRWDNAREVNQVLKLASGSEIWACLHP